MAEEPRERGDLAIHNVSAIILRAGVVASVVVMMSGLCLSLLQTHPTVTQMASLRFSSDYLGILVGAAHGDGVALIELGIFLLVLTPILRVASSMVIFAVHERDWLYACVTFLVLALTLLSLLILK